MERLFETRAARGIAHAIGYAAEMRVPPPLLRPAIRAWALAMGVEMGDYHEPAGGFGSFGDFFVRRFALGARTVAGEADALVSPCDGLLTEIGEIARGSRPVLTAKNDTYDLDGLLATEDAAERFGGGGYLVVYLHPRDYHRVHAPSDATIERVRHIPGSRFPVAPWSERRVRGLFGRNERMVFEMVTAAGDPLTLVMIAAFGVGNIESEHAPDANREGGSWDVRERATASLLRRGDDLGAFRLGSTVVLLWSAGAVEPDGLEAGVRMLMGKRIGRVRTSSPVGATGQEAR